MTNEALLNILNNKSSYMKDIVKCAIEFAIKRGLYPYRTVEEEKTKTNAYGQNNISDAGSQKRNKKVSFNKTVLAGVMISISILLATVVIPQINQNNERIINLIEKVNDNLHIDDLYQDNMKYALLLQHGSVFWFG